VDKRVDAGDTVAPGQVLLTLYDPTHMQLVATVRESLARRLAPGDAIDVEIDALDLRCRGTISEIVPEAQVASRSFAVKVTGPCPEGIYSGMFGRLLIPLEDERILAVPAAAVRRIGQLTTVDVVIGDRRFRRAVQTGRSFDGLIEVLSGLRSGERVAMGRTPGAADGESGE
jgi:multidrug efflux pump subunit AcrA (membrane-fusion protein)